MSSLPQVVFQGMPEGTVLWIVFHQHPFTVQVGVERSDAREIIGNLKTYAGLPGHVPPRTDVLRSDHRRHGIYRHIKAAQGAGSGTDEAVFLIISTHRAAPAV